MLGQHSEFISARCLTWALPPPRFSVIALWPWLVLSFAQEHHRNDDMPVAVLQ
jgi:hypothetical protein